MRPIARQGGEHQDRTSLGHHHGHAVLRRQRTWFLSTGRLERRDGGHARVAQHQSAARRRYPVRGNHRLRCRRGHSRHQRAHGHALRRSPLAGPRRRTGHQIDSGPQRKSGGALLARRPAGYDHAAHAGEVQNRPKPDHDGHHRRTDGLDHGGKSRARSRGLAQSAL